MQEAASHVAVEAFSEIRGEGRRERYTRRQEILEIRSGLRLAVFVRTQRRITSPEVTKGMSSFATFEAIRLFDMTDNIVLYAARVYL